jgi:hypothetical protein
VLDRLVDGAAQRGLLVILDQHRIDMPSFIYTEVHDDSAGGKRGHASVDAWGAARCDD